MKGEYPKFKSNYTLEELTEHFHLSQSDYEFVSQCRGDTNRHAIAVLLKTLQYLGCFPDTLMEVPSEIRLYLARQLNLLWDPSDQYLWGARTRDNHFALIRQYTEFRFASGADKEQLEAWLVKEGIQDALTEETLLEKALERLRERKVEVPAEKELLRMVNAALNAFFLDVHQAITGQASESLCAKLDDLLAVKTEGAWSQFDHLKGDPRQAGIKNLEQEIAKLQQLREIGIDPQGFAGIPLKAVQILKRRAKNETASEMREHPPQIRYSLMACFVWIRTGEVIDDIVRMALDLIHKVDASTEKQLNRELLADIKRVEGKLQILFRVADAVVKNPDGRIREVIFPQVKEETFHHLVAEYQTSGAQYRRIHHVLMRRK